MNSYLNDRIGAKNYLHANIFQEVESFLPSGIRYKNFSLSATEFEELYLPRTKN